MTKSRTIMSSLIERLEELHMTALEIDAFQSAFDDLFNRIEWPARGDQSRRRDLGRLGCYLERVNESIAALLSESRALLQVAVRSSHAGSTDGE